MNFYFRLENFGEIKLRKTRDDITRSEARFSKNAYLMVESFLRITQILEKLKLFFVQFLSYFLAKSCFKKSTTTNPGFSSNNFEEITAFSDGIGLKTPENL